MRFLSDPGNFGYEADLTIDAFRPRIERIAARTAASENAFMIVVLRETNEVIGFGGFNSLPRTAMLNSSERKSDRVPEESKVLAGDMGISIDHHYHRKVRHRLYSAPSINLSRSTKLVCADREIRGSREKPSAHSQASDSARLGVDTCTWIRRKIMMPSGR